MATKGETFVVINYGVTYSALFMENDELTRLKEALAKRPDGEHTIQIRCRQRPSGEDLTKTVVLDKVFEITP
jgi:hypothetical protein